jgi:hypothetical protein
MNNTRLHRVAWALAQLFNRRTWAKAQATFLLLVASVTLQANDVPLVSNGKAVAEIVLASDATPSLRTAARELQRHLRAMSGAELPIVPAASHGVKNHVYLGESKATRKLGFSLAGLKRDGFKIVAAKNHVIVAGPQFYHFEKSFSLLRKMPRNGRQQQWEELTGQKWRFPPMTDDRDFSTENGFHTVDGTGTLYGVYALLEQLGMRWYAPIPELGMVIPRSGDLAVKHQNIKREPEFPVRMFADCRVGWSIPDEFLWYKAIGVGADRFVPLYHSVSGPIEISPEDQPQEYYGRVGGKVDYHTPRLSSERLRDATAAYLVAVDQHFPGIDYIGIGQPDGWSALDSEDVAAGWDKFEQRGKYGRYSDYAWDFNMAVRDRLKSKFPDKKFTVFAYGITNRKPSHLQKVPEDMVIGFTQTAAGWSLPERGHEQAHRQEWIAAMSSPEQLLIWEYYLQHAPNYNFPPVPVIFPSLMKKSFDGLYDHALGFTAEIGWKDGSFNAKAANMPIMARPWISHLMLYLHGKLCWDRDLDIQATMNEYCALFYGPAQAEMKEFFTFAESVWMRPDPREITAASGFLKQVDVDRYFDILGRAKEKTGDTIYGRRIAGIMGEIEPLKRLFEKLKRTGPSLQIKTAREAPVIDGDLTKPFWQADDPQRYTYHPLRDMLTGEQPHHVDTQVTFRWLDDNSALIVGIECSEPKMKRLVETCKTPDSMDIFNDDMVEIRLETASGIRPMIGINSAGVVYDQCVTERVEDLPSFYRVGPAAVKKYADRWTVEVRIDAKPISGARPTRFFPWGVNICRQRKAGNTTEHYMLSPSGTVFKEPTVMGNIFVRQ